MQASLRRPTYIRAGALLAILALAFVTRIWGIGSRDFTGDEALYAFRAVGYLDYLGTSFQTQPIEWYRDAPLPFWTGLSFHDHPPLFFAIQHFFFRLFGDSLFVARLPAVLFGIGAVFLLYRIVKRCLPETRNGERFALLAAFLFAIDGAMVWVFRSSLLEPALLFFILLAVDSFFRFLVSPRSFWLFGIALGLVGLTKYTGFFLVPACIAYLLLARRSVFRDPRLYGAFAIALLVFSPVVLYNIFLLLSRGHFDLQFSYLFGQRTPEWSGLLGKTQDPFSGIGPNLVRTYGAATLALIFLGGCAGVCAYIRKRRSSLNEAPKSTAPRRDGHIFLLSYMLSVTLMLVAIGSADRFLVLYGPAFAIVAAYAVAVLWNMRMQNVGRFLSRMTAIALVGVAAWHMAGKNFLRAEDYGAAKLDRYFQNEFRGKESAVIPQSENPHVNAVIRRFAAKSKGTPALFAIIYDDKVAIPTLLWIFERRLLYHSVPVLYVENFEALQKAGNGKLFNGYTLYFVESTPYTLLNPFKREKRAGAEFEAKLRAQGFSPAETIRGEGGTEMFRVYTFTM